MTREANAAVEAALSKDQNSSTGDRKRKYTHFTPHQSQKPINATECAESCSRSNIQLS